MLVTCFLHTQFSLWTQKYIDNVDKDFTLWQIDSYASLSTKQSHHTTYHFFINLYTNYFIKKIHINTITSFGSLVFTKTTCHIGYRRKIALDDGCNFIKEQWESMILTWLLPSPGSPTMSMWGSPLTGTCVPLSMYFWHPPNKPNKRLAFTSSWPYMDGQREWTCNRTTVWAAHGLWWKFWIPESVAVLIVVLVQNNYRTLSHMHYTIFITIAKCNTGMDFAAIYLQALKTKTGETTRR